MFVELLKRKGGQRAPMYGLVRRLNRGQCVLLECARHPFGGFSLRMCVIGGSNLHTPQVAH